MKLSQFNIFIDKDYFAKALVFNSKTEALVSLDDEARDAYLSLQNKQMIGPLRKDYFETMKQAGLIVNDDYDELKELAYLRKVSQFSQDVISLTIAPTLDCNFRCIYCYEKNNRNHTDLMNKEVQDSVVKYLSDRIKFIKHYHVTWYGGEPLLGMSVIKDLSRRFISLCSENNVSYSAGIISNGYLLSEECAAQLKDCQVSFAQITLDGPRKVHDRRRFTIEHAPTFDRILDNIEKALKYIRTISIRINIDSNNQGNVPQLQKELESRGLFEKVKPYLGFVDNINDCYSTQYCLSYDKFANMKFDFEINQKALGLTKSMTTYYPRGVRTYCGAECLSFNVVAPDGKLYKCWNDIGNNSRSVGSLLLAHTKDAAISNVLFEYMLFDPTEDPVCGKCNLLPLCMGGCPQLRREKKPNCSFLKYTINKYLYAVLKEQLNGLQLNNE